MTRKGLPEVDLRWLSCYGCFLSVRITLETTVRFRSGDSISGMVNSTLFNRVLRFWEDAYEIGVEMICCEV
jgi:hypothetical protein